MHPEYSTHRQNPAEREKRGFVMGAGGWLRPASDVQMRVFACRLARACDESIYVVCVLAIARRVNAGTRSRVQPSGR